MNERRRQARKSAKVLHGQATRHECENTSFTPLI